MAPLDPPMADAFVEEFVITTDTPSNSNHTVNEQSWDNGPIWRTRIFERWCQDTPNKLTRGPTDSSYYTTVPVQPKQLTPAALG